MQMYDLETVVTAFSNAITTITESLLTSQGIQAIIFVVIIATIYRLLSKAKKRR